jgi:hypothetical protein
VEIQTWPHVVSIRITGFKFGYGYYWSLLLMKDIYLFTVILTSLTLKIVGGDPFARVSLFHSIKKGDVSLFLNDLLN